MQTSSTAERNVLGGGHDGAAMTFLALRAVQAGREYFVTVCPLRWLPRLFSFDEPDLPAELRAQRVLNAARIPEIARYLVDNPTSYVLSAITASIDDEVGFEPLEVISGASVGKLTVPLTARLLVNDGQHRRAAVEEALRQRPAIGDETVAVIFFLDAGLKRSQQMFADLNRYALKPTRSLGILYDHRDPLAQLARQIVASVEPFVGYTELEKTSISNRSTKLFTLSGVYQAAEALLGRRRAVLSDEDVELAVRFWAAAGRLLRGWGFISADRSAAELRKDFIHTHAVALHALGLAGADLVAAQPEDWEEALELLGDLDWSRRNGALWEGRALRSGRISKAGPSVLLTANVLKTRLSLPLSAAEQALEEGLERVTRVAA